MTHLSAGIGFKAQHLDAALAAPADGLWFEVHAENYMVEGGVRPPMLEALAERFALSLHGVGLSLAGAARPDREHLAALARLVHRFEPVLVSEHLAWSRLGDRALPDLLPFPRSQAALDRIAANIAETQDVLGRAILVENPSHYLALEGHAWNETDFLTELARRTGCGLLLDLNNVVVSAGNLGFAADEYLAAFPSELVGEIHIAGHKRDATLDFLVDNHGAPVGEPVWELLDTFVRRHGTRPVLLERDRDVPDFVTLVAERNRAAALLAPARETAHA